MKKNNNKYLILTGGIILVLLIIIGIVYFFSNRSNNYSFNEKNWINSNSNNIIDVSFEGSLPVFSNNGEGVFYDFINELENDTKLTFNVVVNSNAAYSFENKNETNANDILLYEDHYVLISTNNNEVRSLNDITNQPIGVISGDKNYVNNYLNSYNLNFKEYNNFTNLKSDFSNSIIYAIVPLQKYINEIVSNNYNIVYHIEGLSSNYVISVNSDNAVLTSIFNKFYKKIQDSIYTKVSSHIVSLYYQTLSVSDLEKEKITADDILVGYIDNMPLEGKINSKFSGITNEYLTLFGEATGATFKYIKYNDLDSMIKALNNKKIDLLLNYYNISNSNYIDSVKLGNSKYVVAARLDNDVVIEGLKSINKNVKMLNNTKLYSFIRDNGVNVSVNNNYKELIKSLDINDIIIMEKSAFDYYKNRDLNDYVIKYLGLNTYSNSFLLNSDNNTFNNLFNFYLSTLGNEFVSSKATYASNADANKNVILDFALKNIIYIIALVLALAFLIFRLNRKVKITKKIKKEDKMMYLDVMTNLKNRNYLNDNLVYWESNKIYPQTIVVVDLNDIAVINDTKGHEEGDKQIIAAARILINTQRENSEIIRTNGNEFLVYLVGYDEKQIVTYVNKLVKEFKELPYNYGAAVGYSMITAESTTIDDAINEALLMMRKNKGE